MAESCEFRVNLRLRFRRRAVSGQAVSDESGFRRERFQTRAVSKGGFRGRRMPSSVLFFRSSSQVFFFLLDPPRSGSVPISGLADSSAPKANSYDLRKEALWPTVPAAAIGRVHGQRNNSRFERGSASPAGALRKSCDDEREGSQRASRGRWRRSTHERDEQRRPWSAVSVRSPLWKFAGTSGDRASRSHTRIHRQK